MTVDQNSTPLGTEDVQERALGLVSAPDALHASEAPLAIDASTTEEDSRGPAEAPAAIHDPESVPEQSMTPTSSVEGDAHSSASESAPTSISAPEVVVPQDIHPEPEPAATEATSPTSVASETASPSVDPEAVLHEATPPEERVAPEIAPEAVLEATPEESPEPVVSESVIEEPVAAQAVVEPPKPGASDMDLFESYMSAMDRGEDPEAAIDSGYKRLQKGDRIEATVIQVDKDKLFVDLGTKAEGIIPLAELSDENLDTAKGLFNIGDKINVVVLRPEGAEGNPIVSKRRADFEEAWDRIEEAFQTKEMITAQVVDRVKGGLVVDVGVRGFVPATHVGSGKLRNIEKFVGQPLQLKVIEIDRDRKKVVLSNREAEEERRQSAKEEIFKAVKPGEILEGSVRRLTDYGAFVDLGGVDGLLHISEMSWARINHPKEIFKEGQKIKVMVLRLDEKAGKISLGHRQVLPDPWNLIKQNYRIQQNLMVTIGRIVQSGAFIKLPEGAEAFMPVSEMSFRRIKRPQDVVEENQEVEAQIIDLRPDERRMVLSMRAIGGGGELRPSSPDSPPYDDGPRGKDRAKKGGKKGSRGGRDFDDDFEESVGRRGFATSGATIGERLGMLKGFLSRDEDEEEKPAVEAETETKEEE